MNNKIKNTKPCVTCGHDFPIKIPQCPNCHYYDLIRKRSGLLDNLKAVVLLGIILLLFILLEPVFTNP